jgi:hypothetical protein
MDYWLQVERINQSLVHTIKQTLIKENFLFEMHKKRDIPHFKRQKTIDLFMISHVLLME